MLVVFAFSITPRVVLHGWFASHKDAPGKKSSAGGEHQLAKSTYNCNCDNIVAESPFTEPAGIFGLAVFQPFSIEQKMDICSFHSSAFFLFTLRGPPVVG